MNELIEDCNILSVKNGRFSSLYESDKEITLMFPQYADREKEYPNSVLSIPAIVRIEIHL